MREYDEYLAELDREMESWLSGDRAPVVPGYEGYAEPPTPVPSAGGLDRFPFLVCWVAFLTAVGFFIWACHMGVWLAAVSFFASAVIALRAMATTTG